jgi:hypothetical protein
MEMFKALYLQNIPSIKASEGLATTLNQQRNPNLKIGLGYEEGSSSGQPRNKNPSSFSNLHSLTTTNMEKQRKIISCQGRVKEKVPELNM